VNSSAHRNAAAGRVREVKGWVRAATSCPEAAVIVVSELACSEPGCPPYEVVMAVLAPGERPLRRKLHKRLGDLTEPDVQAVWAAPDAHAPSSGDAQATRET
jgi:hypothetical protein